MKSIKIIVLFALALFSSMPLLAQEPIRVGTTAGEFLTVGYGSAGVSMGDAYVSVVNDLSGVYFNPAGLAFMDYSEAMFTYQPWLVDIQTFLAAAGVVLPRVGTIGISAIGVNYGEMDVTTVEDQDGTGETFSVKDYAFALTYGRKLAQWFGFGASAKYITSSIWHESASAFAFDLGVIINTPFFSPNGDAANGMNIGMSLSNYGTPLKYDGLDLLRSYDIMPEGSGNYQDTKVKFMTDGWELPLIFRIGASFTPLVVQNHQVTLAVDALHVNNNNECINLGAEYMLYAPGVARFYLRGGYRALFLQDSEFGLTYGAGIERQYFGNKSLKLDFAYRDIGILGMIPSFGVTMRF
ncbi:PorV/PorQ family protein [candidate division KSB1 bacterium]|nr:PorV/PorQ family protein [candidate division KSB1 bacterium]